MLNFDSEWIIALILSSILLGLLAPYISRGFQHLGLIEIEGESIDD